MVERKEEKKLEAENMRVAMTPQEEKAISTTYVLPPATGAPVRESDRHLSDWTKENKTSYFVTSVRAMSPWQLARQAEYEVFFAFGPQGTTLPQLRCTMLAL